MSCPAGGELELGLLVLLVEAGDLAAPARQRLIQVIFFRGAHGLRIMKIRSHIIADSFKHLPIHPAAAFDSAMFCEKVAIMGVELEPIF